MNGILANFEFNEDGTQALKCPAGQAPKSCCYLKTSGCCQLSFDRSQCANCPHKDDCKAKIFKKVSRVAVSIMGRGNAIQQRLMETEEYKLLARIRNGVETVMSAMRRVCHVDAMPVRGLVRGRLFFGCKIAAQRAGGLALAGLLSLAELQEALRIYARRGQVCPKPAPVGGLRGREPPKGGKSPVSRGKKP